MKDQEFQMLQVELEKRTRELSESTELLNQQVNEKLKTTLQEMLMWQTVSRTQFYWLFQMFIPHPVEGVFVLVFIFVARANQTCTSRRAAVMDGDDWKCANSKPFNYTFYFLLLNWLLYYIFPTAVLRSSAFPRASDFVSHFSQHIRNSLLCELTCIESPCFVRQAAGEGEAGVRAAERAGRDERLPGASQEKEQCRFPVLKTYDKPCHTSSAIFYVTLQNIL